MEFEKDYNEETYSDKKECCEKVTYQYADVKIPVKIKPKAVIGHVETKCIGDPEVKRFDGACKESCNLIISQKVIIKIPITYHVETKAGPDCVDCNPRKDHE